MFAKISYICALQSTGFLEVLNHGIEQQRVESRAYPCTGRPIRARVHRGGELLHPLWTGGLERVGLQHTPAAAGDLADDPADHRAVRRDLHLVRIGQLADLLLGVHPGLRAIRHPDGSDVRPIPVRRHPQRGRRNCRRDDGDLGRRDRVS